MPKVERVTCCARRVGDVGAPPALDPVDPVAPVDLVQRRVLPTGRVRLSCIATSPPRSRVRPLRCRAGRGQTVLRTRCCPSPWLRLCAECTALTVCAEGACHPHVDQLAPVPPWS